jgi:hypothetical protein
VIEDLTHIRRSACARGSTALADLCGVQGESCWHCGGVRQPCLHQSDVLPAWQSRQAREGSFRVRTLWSPGAGRLECESKPCPDGGCL